ncbi:efflux RND transporter periplasmic adaptor subunit, partial [bacterium]|nr:efflux RND transporter periplasmic adaptor subunit [bacterium]
MMRCPPALLLAAFLMGLAAGCGKTDPSTAKSGPPESIAPRSVRVVRPEIRPLERSTQVVGTLAPYEETLVSAQVAGQIEKMRVDLGDRVATGHELAQIDTTSFEALARQSAAVLSKAAASAENAARTLARIQDLQSNNIASTSELDQAVAEAAQARAEVKSAEAAGAIAQLNLQRSHVKAPFDGAVAERLASVGAYVAVGTPIVRMVKTDPLRLRLLVPERESVDVKTGQAARVTLENDTNTYVGTISRVAPAVRESDRMLLVEADVPNPGTLRAGLFARARIIIR